MTDGFTPGPWPIERTGDGKRYLIGKGLVEGPNGYEVAEVYADDCDADTATANSRLIAAAPDLLLAAEMVLAGLNQRIANAPQENVPLFDGVVELHDAIAKARGEA